MVGNLVRGELSRREFSLGEMWWLEMSRWEMRCSPRLANTHCSGEIRKRREEKFREEKRFSSKKMIRESR